MPLTARLVQSFPDKFRTQERSGLERLGDVFTRFELPEIRNFGS